MDIGMNKIFQWAGAIITLMGVLIVWRGITKMIPASGVFYGTMFSLGGVLFILFGVFFLVYAARSKRKHEEKTKKELEG